MDEEREWWDRDEEEDYGWDDEEWEQMPLWDDDISTTQVIQLEGIESPDDSPSSP